MNSDLQFQLEAFGKIRDFCLTVNRDQGLWLKILAKTRAIAIKIFEQDFEYGAKMLIGILIIQMY